MNKSVQQIKTLLGRVRVWSAVSVLAAVTFSAGYLARGVAADVPALLPIPIDPTVKITGEQPVPKDMLLAGSPALRTADHVFYVSPHGTMQVAVSQWDTGGSTAKVHLDVDADEFVVVLDGRASVRAADGRSWSLKRGDAILLPNGFHGTARVFGHFRDEYVQVPSPSSPKG